MNRLLIFDLDDTIFETKSIGRDKVQSILDNFRNQALAHYAAAEIDLIIEALWKRPFDAVAEQYQFNEAIKRNFAKSVEASDFDLDIKPFEDYALTKNIPGLKYLVTTGFRKLQEAKIAALDLDFDPSKIFIDDILEVGRIHKTGLFKHIMTQSNFPPEAISIIGDNPESELKAGFQLGLNTIQLAKFGQERSKYANHYITRYEELTPCL